MAAHSLVFQNTTFDIVDRNGQPWLKLGQIAVALGYGKGGGQSEPTLEASRNVRQLYERHSDEFTDSMTALVKLPSAGGEQETRIFSLRGCHLLAMLARTKIAKEFRKWVLDILERVVGQPEPVPFVAPPTVKALPGKLTAESQDHIKAAIRSRLEPVPKNLQGQAARTLWGALNLKFGTKGLKDGYKNIPEEGLTECLSLIARVPLNGEPPEPLTGEVLSPESPTPSNPLDALAQYLKNARFCVAFNGEGKFQLTEVDPDGRWIKDNTLAKLIREPGEIDRRLLPEIIEAAASRLKAA